jgi:hypothetical protein
MVIQHCPRFTFFDNNTQDCVIKELHQKQPQIAGMLTISP